MKLLIKKFAPRFLLSWYYELWAFLGALVYRFPSDSVKVVGVTGTNGKTSTVHLASHILEQAGFTVASISSLRFKVGAYEERNNLKMTMPGRFFIQRFLRRAADAGCDVVLMEVTSEGIVQKRHAHIRFHTAVFTNLTPEHIESHGGFQNYKKAKGELFISCGNTHIINARDSHAAYFLQFPAKNIIQYEGVYMEGNREAARSIARSFGVSDDIIEKALASAPHIPGRMEIVTRDPFFVVVDYAHTPDALEKTYKEVKSVKLTREHSRMVCVLGSAGGGRDTWKRPEMGKIAAQYCDSVILTNEDPYDESPLSILKQIEKGFSEARSQKPEIGSRKPEVQKILDRRRAIHTALESAGPGDIVIITGKGGETRMMTKNGPIPWDDRKIVEEEFPRV